MLQGTFDNLKKWSHPSAVAATASHVAFMCSCKLVSVVLDMTIVVVLLSEVSTMYG
jgi:hypothetical protein